MLRARTKTWVAALAAVALTPAAVAQDTSFGDAPHGEDVAGRRYVYGFGPGARRTAVAMGVRVIYVVPNFDLAYVGGATDETDFEFRLSSLLLTNLVETGFRWRLVGSERLSLAVRADVTALVTLAFASDGPPGFAASIGVTPGAAASFGAPGRYQVTLGVDAPIVLASNDVGEELLDLRGTSGVGVLLRPSAAFELPVGARTNLCIQLQAYVPMWPRAIGAVVPALAVGAGW